LPSTRALEDEQLRPKVVEAFKVGRGTYGSPRVLDELIDQGFEVGRRRVARLMRQLGLRGVMPRKFRVTTDSDHEHPIAQNMLGHEGGELFIRSAGQKTEWR
jgi:transposase InsO family protein